MLNLLLVGVKGRGESWLRAINASPKLTLAGCVDVATAHLEAVQAEYGVPAERCFVDLQEALETAKPDAVVISSPPQFHPAMAVQAMNAGCHVLTEKPLADTWDGCLAISEAARQTGKQVMVAQNYRYSRVMQTFRRCIAQGELGSPKQAAVQFFQKEPVATAGFRKRMRYPLVSDMAVHHFDLMRYLLGAEATAVLGMSWNPPWSPFEGDTSCIVHLTFQAIGSDDPIHVAYTASNTAHGAHTPWNGDWQIFCEGGAYVLRSNRVYISRDGAAELQEVPIVQDGLFDLDYMLDEFARSVSEAQEPETSVFDNLRTMAVVFQTIRSFDTGAQVAIEVE